MIGLKTYDGTYIWLDRQGRVRTAGPLANYWLRAIDQPHMLLDLDAKARFESANPGVIMEPGSIERPIRSDGELREVVRRYCTADGQRENLREYVQIPERYELGDNA